MSAAFASDLFSSTVSSAPQILLDSLPKVRKAFDYLEYLLSLTCYVYV